jgi:GT2 family glycosyltransferase
MVSETPNNDEGDVFQLVVAVVLNWNGKQDTLECLETLNHQSYPNLRIILVDNHSTDGSPKAVSEHYPDVELIINPEDYGFGRGLNVGIRRGLLLGADFIFTVSNDTLVEKDCIQNLLKSANPETGLLAPMIYYAQQPNVIWALGGQTNRWNLEKQSPWDNQLDQGGWPEVIDQDFVTGCALLFPRSTLEDVGGFDEKIFMYYEDSDLCMRIRKAGRKILVVPSAKMWHKVAASSGGIETPTERYWMARSSIYFFKKHARGIQIPIVILWRAGSALRTTFRLARMKKWHSLKSYWLGLYDGLRNRNLVPS